MCNPADNSLLETRLPVWRVLSMFFLDTELDDPGYRYIATQLAASPYSLAELEAILLHEVYPACRVNLLSPAGEWAGFDDDWLQERISPYLHRRAWWYCWPLHGWMFREHWRIVRARVQALRA